jgi:hypothetical protein
VTDTDRPTSDAVSRTIPTSLPVEHLFTMHLELTRQVFVPRGEGGVEVVVGFLAGTVTGHRLNGTVAPFIGHAKAEVRHDGFARMSVDLVITTHDRATIAVSGTGIMETGPVRHPRVSLLFETARDEYLWLNHVQAIAIGTPGRDEVTYEAYALV